MPDTVPIKISAASARLPFHGCTPEYIRDTCHAACCKAPSRPTGVLISIHRTEQEAIEAYGVRVEDGMLQPAPGCRTCPFHVDTVGWHCQLHHTPHKPAACITYPFDLNPSGTLIIINRAKLLPCYNAGPRIPAYRAFTAALVLLFGQARADWLVAHLDQGGGDAVLPADAQVVQVLWDNLNDRRVATGRRALPPLARQPSLV